MAITILPKEQTAGELIGSAFGSGISEGLRQQANIASQLKMQQLLNNLKVQQYGPAFQKEGIPVEWATMEPAMFSALMKNRQQQAAQQNMAGLMQALQQGQQPQGFMPGMAPEQQMGAEGYQAPEAQGQQMAASQYQAPQGPQPINMEAIAPFLQNMPPDQQKYIMDYIQKQNLGAQKFGQAERHAREARSAKIYGSLAKYIEKANDTGSRADQKIKSLLEMKRLNDSGELDSASKATLLDYLGLGSYPNLLNESGAEFDAHATSLWDGTFKEMFGGRMNKEEFKEFLKKQLPSLLQKQNGRDIVINRWLSNTLAAKNKQKVWNNMLDEWGDNIPNNALSQLNKETSRSNAKMLKELSEGILPEEYRQGKDLEAAIQDPLKYAEYYKLGTVHEDDSGVRRKIELVNGTKKWVEV